MRQTYSIAEPAVLFIDRINALNPLSYRDTITATNSCAEQPLPPNGTCPLASVNLAQLVRSPFTDKSALDATRLRHLVGVGVRMLDNAVSISKFALVAQNEMALRQRRIGLGVTGVADALAMLGVRYGSPRAVYMLGRWMQIIQNEAYKASAYLAKERGVFADFDRDEHLSQPCMRNLDADLVALIKDHGLRNATLTTIAPTGTISMLAGKESSGIEPIFSPSFTGSLGPQGQTNNWSPTHVHRKGGQYRLIGYGINEADRTPVAIYDDRDGTVWVRQVRVSGRAIYTTVPPRENNPNRFSDRSYVRCCA